MTAYRAVSKATRHKVAPALHTLFAETAEEFEEGEALAEAEAELGISGWIDPETLAPAEDHIPRLEDH
jgi:hypothetical protein